MSALDLGVTQEELRKLVVERAADKLLEELDDVGGLGDGIDKRVKDAITAHIDPIIQKIGFDTVAPRVEALIEGLTFQKTSAYGEPKAPAQTWRELLIERAEGWLAEPVDNDGKSKSESRGYSSEFRQRSTRIAYLVDKHLQFHIDAAMKAALLDANKKLAQGILDAVRLGLNTAAAGIKIEVKSTR